MNKDVAENLSYKIESIIQSSSFQKLVKTRNLIRFSLAFLVMLIHAFFIGGIAFYNDWFALPFISGSIIPNGIFYTVFVIVSMLVLEFVYIFTSENQLEKFQQQALKEIKEND